jgi:hypothetical protein
VASEVNLDNILSPVPPDFAVGASGSPFVLLAREEERSIFWEAIVSAFLSRVVYVYMCPVPNRSRDTAISLYSYKIVDKKEILRTVSNAGIYCPSNKVGSV